MSATPTPTRPNLLVVVSDQLRRHALGTYGDPNVSTPHIDALASAGVRFERATSTYPVCVPFRFSLMTGEYAHTRSVPSIEWRLSPAERTLAHEFNDAGYETIYIGKWHLYGGGGGVLPGYTRVKANRTPVPREHRGGWQKWLGFEFCNDPFDTVYFEDDDPTPRPITRYQTDGLFDLAMEYLADRGDDARPFCCVVSVEPPHPLFDAPEEYLQRWRGRDLQLRPNVQLPSEYRVRGRHSADMLDDLRTYYAMVENIDDNVGRMLNFLRSHDLAQDTIVVFLADHGELLGSHGLQNKQYPHEESVGIPLIIGDPHAPQVHGSTVQAVASTEDLFPTLLGLVGLEPAQPKPGADLSPLVRGERDRLDRPGVLLEFVAEYRPRAPFYEETWRAFLSDRYKYVVRGGPTGGEPWLFFDLQNDPYELTNLVTDPRHSAEMARHHHLLRNAMVRTGDHYVLKPALGAEAHNDWSWPPPGDPLHVR